MKNKKKGAVAPFFLLFLPFFYFHTKVVCTSYIKKTAYNHIGGYSFKKKKNKEKKSKTKR